MYTVGLDKWLFFTLFFQLGIYRVAKFSTKGKGSDPDRIKEILFGSLLGDGKLEMSPRSINARFGFTQSEDHKDYFISVCNSLSTICSTKYREHSYVDKRTGKTYKSLNF
jgi:hypothetical protein